MSPRRPHGDLGSRRKEEVVEEEEGEVEDSVEPPHARRRSRKGSRPEGQVVEEQGREERSGLTPYDDARALLREVHARTDKVIVGLSGGKDSLVTLDLCVREFGAPNVSCYFMYLVKGLRCVETILKWCERRYKVDVHYLPHWQLGLAYKYATYMPHYTGVNEWRDMRLVDVEQVARKKSGAEWFAYGHRMTDSIERVGMLKKNHGLEQVGRRVYPLWRWNEASVMAYLRQRKIPQPPKLSFLKRSMTGVSFQVDTLLAIQHHYPDDFAKIVEKFPFVEAKLARHKMQKQNWKQDTYLDKWKTSLNGRW